MFSRDKQDEPDAIVRNHEGEIECESCGHILHVKDIQGQLLDSMKNAVSEAMGGGK